ncbi:MAG: hypothetical protein AUJ53_02825 [Flavobacteriaceae bacterium CG1_02_35_72]|nr:MAG: hypothetical protein AUJ53_02825 [Flavobacteriaceae bacterium CG1_02_35_72]
MDIIKVLQVTEEQYYCMMVESYLSWAENFSSDARCYQSLAANSKISSWYNFEYAKLEKLFFDTFFIETDLSVQSIRLYYADITNRMFFIYPGALFNNQNNKQIEPNFNLN